jgi:hypothetical protein
MSGGGSVLEQLVVKSRGQRRAPTLSTAPTPAVPLESLKEASQREHDAEARLFSSWASRVRHNGQPLKWTNIMARARFALLRHLSMSEEWRFDGDNPVVLVDPSPNGAAYIRHALGYFEWRIYGSSGDAFLHTNPAPHHDFLQGGVSYSLLHDNPVKPTERDAQRAADVARLTESVLVYPIGRIGGACHFIGATIATVDLAVDVAEGTMSLADAKRAYGPRIKKLFMEQQAYDERCRKEDRLVITGPILPMALGQLRASIARIRALVEEQGPRVASQRVQ